MQNFPNFCSQDPSFFSENLLPRPYFWKPVWHITTKKKSWVPPGHWCVFPSLASQGSQHTKLPNTILKKFSININTSKNVHQLLTWFRQTLNDPKHFISAQFSIQSWQIKHVGCIGQTFHTLRLSCDTTINYFHIHNSVIKCILLYFFQVHTISS